MSRPGPRIALCTWASGQPGMLCDNLLYHRRLGVEHVYLFVDDGGERAAGTVPEVPWVERLARSSGTSPVALHQERCMSEARDRAREAGWNWLLCLDPDEFASGIERVGRRAWLRGLGRGPAGARPEDRSSLTRLVGALDPGVQSVVLGVLEAIPPAVECASPPREVLWFQVGRGLRRRIRSPRGDAAWRVGFLGHAFGKSLIRVDADAEPRGPHVWQGRRERLVVCRRGLVHHYFLPGARDWHRKLRGRLDGRPLRAPHHHPVPPLNAACFEAARSWSESDAVDYFRREMVPSRWRVLLAAAWGGAVRSTAVRDVLVGVDACPGVAEAPQ